MEDLAQELARMGLYGIAFFHNGGINPKFSFDENRELTHLMFRELWLTPAHVFD